MAATNELKISWRTKFLLEIWHCGAAENNVDKDSKGQRQQEDSGERLVPAVEGYSLEQNRNIKQHTILAETYINFPNTVTFILSSFKQNIPTFTQNTTTFGQNNIAATTHIL